MFGSCCLESLVKHMSSEDTSVATHIHNIIIWREDVVWARVRSRVSQMYVKNDSAMYA